MSFYSLENRKRGALRRVPDDGCIKISHFIGYRVKIGASKIRHLIQDLEEGAPQFNQFIEDRGMGASNCHFMVQRIE